MCDNLLRLRHHRKEPMDVSAIRSESEPTEPLLLHTPERFTSKMATCERPDLAIYVRAEPLLPRKPYGAHFVPLREVLKLQSNIAVQHA